MWSYPGIDVGNMVVVYDYAVKNRTNFISPSQPNLDGSTNQFGPSTFGTTVVTPGFTAPDGSTSASEFRTTSSMDFRPRYLGGYLGPDTRNYGEGPHPTPVGSGPTCYFSFWQNTSVGTTGGKGNRIFAISDRGLGTFEVYNGRQIYPTLGTAYTSIVYPGFLIDYPQGSCGWVRFVFELGAPTGGSWASWDVGFINESGGGKTFYFWGWQFEFGTTFPQSRYDAGIADYKPNILSSGNTYTGAPDYAIVTSGVTVWNSNPEWVGQWGESNGMTYLAPNIPEICIWYGTTASPGPRSWSPKELLFSGVTKTQIWNKAVNYLKAFPENKRAIRMQPIEASGLMIFSNYNDALTGSGYTSAGKSFTYRDSDYNIITSVTGYVGNLWPVEGISAAQRAYNEFFKALAITGATIAYASFDVEPGNPWGDLDDTQFESLVAQDPRWQQTWNGVTSFAQMMADIDARMPFRSRFLPGNPRFDGLKWGRVSGEQNAKAYELAFAPAWNYFPKMQIGNYENFFSSELVQFGPNSLNGPVSPGERIIGKVGNQFAAPLLYGEIGIITNERISGNDPSFFDNQYDRNLYINSDGIGITGLKLQAGTGTYPVSGVTSPFGNYSIGLFTENATNDLHMIYAGGGYDGGQATLESMGNTQAYVFSTYLKRPNTNAHRYVTLVFRVVPTTGVPVYSENRYAVTYDLLNGTTTQAFYSIFGCGYTSAFVSHGITHAGNSWYRCWISDAGVTIGNYAVRTQINGSNSPTPSSGIGPSYTGNGLSGFYAWGVQMELGTLPSAYERRMPGFTFVSQLDLAWISFVRSMQQVRTHKRNSDVPQMPWIADINYQARGTGITAATPGVGYANANVGYNPRTGNTYTQRGGNSAYYYEMIRHAMLHGTKGFNLWPGGGLYGDVRTGIGSNQYIQTYNYILNGDCGWYYDLKNLNTTIKEVNDLLGGFTLTAGNVSRPSWVAPYEVSGAPGPKGTTWWWRVTVNPQNKIVVNGTTLDGASGPYGTWVSTTGPTLAHVPITIL
jgi:hypothetical protein